MANKKIPQGGFLFRRFHLKMLKNWLFLQSEITNMNIFGTGSRSIPSKTCLKQVLKAKQIKNLLRKLQNIPHMALFVTTSE